MKALFVMVKIRAGLTLRLMAVNVDNRYKMSLLLASMVSLPYHFVFHLCFMVELS